MNYFQVDVRYERITGDDNIVKVKESYLICGAATCGDAEKVVMDEIKPFVFGECDTPKIQRRQFFDSFSCIALGDSIYYEAKVEIITIDGETETRKAVPILVVANSFSDALTCLTENICDYDCEIIGLKRTAITDILTNSK